MNRKFIIILLILFVVILQSCTKKINSADELFKEMHNRYKGVWFNQISFSQTTHFYEEDSIVNTEKWLEEYKFPGNLIIKINFKTSQDGYLYRNDSVYQFIDGVAVMAQQQYHDLLFLSKDIYNTPLDKINDRLALMNYDTGKFYKTKYNDRQAFVVGSDPGDYQSNQFWYDAEYLYLLRVIRDSGNGIQEVLFDDYIEIPGQGWMEQELTFKLDGIVYMTERYYDIKIAEHSSTSFQSSDFDAYDLKIIPKKIDIINNDIIISSGKYIVLMIFREMMP